MVNIIPRLLYSWRVFPGIWWASEPVWMWWQREDLAPAGNRTPVIFQLVARPFSESAVTDVSAINEHI